MNRTNRRPNLRWALWLLPLLLFARFSLAADEESKLIAIAAMQPLLAQQIAKSYLSIGADFFAENAREQLREQVKALAENHAELKAKVRHPEAMLLLAVVDNAVRQIEALAAKPFSGQGGAGMLDFSDVIMEEGGNIARLLADGESPAPSAILEAQRLHNERIAKLYLARQLGVGGAGASAQLDQALADFERNLGDLNSANAGDPAAVAELRKVDRVFRTACKLMGEEEGGRINRVTLFSFNNIATSLDRIQKLTKGSDAPKQAD